MNKPLTSKNSFMWRNRAYLVSFCLSPLKQSREEKYTDTFFFTKKKRFYKVGYKDGFAHGRLHGLIEGRTLGAEKGFELWEELGFYEGAARLWTAAVSTDAGGVDRCALTYPCFECCRSNVSSFFAFSCIQPRGTPRIRAPRID
jgi:hypothetical protein